MEKLHEAISQEIWNIKYRYRSPHKNLDKNIEATWLRVAKAAARAEKTHDRLHWQKKFYDILSDFKFLPGGRILAGAGTKNKVTLFNCFVMNIAEDSLSGIFNALKEGALTLQQGGGIGYDFSLLRPQGELAEQTGITASGPVSFMQVWNTMCGIMLSTGTRRGAMMGVLRCDHPDIETFITAKNNPLELRNFNVSVLVTDEFMQAVKTNAEFSLVYPLHSKEKYSESEVVHKPYGINKAMVPCRIYRTINARTLWEKIIKSAYDFAEPGVLFEDTINRMNNLNYCERISATNPCGEIPLPSYGACNLGAINLTQFVIDPLSEKAKLDWQGIETCSAIATRFLDNIIDISRYPLRAQQREALATRRIGLGFTGLADMFVMLGIKYGSQESLALARKIMEKISRVTWNTSIQLAEEKNSFPYFDKEKYLQGNFVATLPVEIKNGIEKYGIRNSHHNTIAPTGTTSILANNISSGIEPIFSGKYERTVVYPEGERKKFLVTDYALHLWQQKNSTEKFPPAWIDTTTLTPENHLQMQAAVQPFVDNAISKTINLPIDFPFEKLAQVYTQAFDLGLKGCTIFRPNNITGSVIEFSDREEDVERCCKLA